jgi:hypothetical protein
MVGVRARGIRSFKSGSFRHSPDDRASRVRLHADALPIGGASKLEELDRRFIQEGETSGMDVKLEEVRGALDDVTDLGIVVTVRGIQRFLTWGGVVGIALVPTED